jgi:hypothetical protein
MAHPRRKGKVTLSIVAKSVLAAIDAARERGYGDQGTEYTFSEADVCSYFGSFSESTSEESKAHEQRRIIFDPIYEWTA